MWFSKRAMDCNNTKIIPIKDLSWTRSQYVFNTPPKRDVVHTWCWRDPNPPLRIQNVFVWSWKRVGDCNIFLEVLSALNVPRTWLSSERDVLSCRLCTDVVQMLKSTNDLSSMFFSCLWNSPLNMAIPGEDSRGGFWLMCDGFSNSGICLGGSNF